MAVLLPHAPRASPLATHPFRRVPPPPGAAHTRYCVCTMRHRTQRCNGCSGCNLLNTGGFVTLLDSTRNHYVYILASRRIGMALLNFDMRGDTRPSPSPLGDAIGGWSIEVMPRTAAKVENFRALLPADTLVYIAHIAGTPIEDMVATARRLHDEGFAVMPHFPARAIADKAMLEDWIRRYRDEAGVSRALLLGGGNAEPAGDFDSSIQLIETGLFD